MERIKLIEAIVYSVDGVLKFELISNFPLKATRELLTLLLDEELEQFPSEGIKVE